MPKIVDVPGVGRVRFPDSMSDEDIRRTLETKPWAPQGPAIPPPNYAPQWQAPISPPPGMMGAPTGTYGGTPFQGVYQPYTSPAAGGGAPLPGMPFTPGMAAGLMESLPQGFGGAGAALREGIGGVMAPIGWGLSGAWALGADAANQFTQHGGLFNPAMIPFRMYDKGMTDEKMAMAIPGYEPPQSNLDAWIQGDPLPTRTPLHYAGDFLHGTGKFGVAGLADLGIQMSEAGGPVNPFYAASHLLYPTPEEIDTPTLRRSRIPAPSVIEPTPSNLGEWMRGAETLPSENLSNLGPVIGGFGRASQGMVESGPRIAAMTALTAAGVPVAIAGGGAFGVTGDPAAPIGLEGEQTAIGIILPGAGRAGGEAGKLAFKAMGAVEPQTINWGVGIGATMAPVSGLAVEQFAKIADMERQGLISPEEAKAERANIWWSAGYNAFQGPMGAKWATEAGRPPIIPRRRAVSGTPVITGENNLTPLAAGHLHNAQEGGAGYPLMVLSEPEVPPVIGQRITGPQPTSGAFMRANRDEGFIEVSPSGLNHWLSTIPEARRESALRHRLNEEAWHMLTTPEQAMQFWRSLPRVAQGIIARAYTGNWGGRDAITGNPLKESELAEEALRIYLQRFNRGDIAEVAEGAINERMTLRSLFALNDVMMDSWQRLMGAPGNKNDVDIRRRILEAARYNMSKVQQIIEAGGDRAALESVIPPKPPVIEAEAADAPFARAKQRIPYDERTKAIFEAMRLAGEDPDIRAQAEAAMLEDAQATGFNRWQAPPRGTQGRFEDAYPGAVQLELPTQRTPYARQDTQAAEVYGDMRPQPGEGPAQVPVPEGGAGVQPQAEAGLPVGPAARTKRKPFAYGFPDTISQADDMIVRSFNNINELVQARDPFALKELENLKFFLDMLLDHNKNLIEMGPEEGAPLSNAEKVVHRAFIARLEEAKAQVRNFEGFVETKGFGEEYFPASRAKKGPGEEGPDLFGIPDVPLASQEAYQRFASGDQKVMTDASGKPMKIYHGTPSSRVMGGLRPPIFVSDSEVYAKTYRGFKEERKPGDVYTSVRRTGNLLEGYIKYKNPLQWDKPGAIDVVEAVKIFRNTGYDAILNPKHKEFVVRDADQVFIEKASPAGRFKKKPKDEGPDLFSISKTPPPETPKPPAPEKPAAPPPPPEGLKPPTTYTPKPIQTGMDFEAIGSAVPQHDPTKPLTGPSWARITPATLEQTMTSHVLEGADPSFEAFAKLSRDKWGMDPGQVGEVWKNNLWDTLMGATGDQLTRLLYRRKLDRLLPRKMRRFSKTPTGERAELAQEMFEKGQEMGTGPYERRLAAGKGYGVIPDAPPEQAAKQPGLGIQGGGEITHLKQALRRANTVREKQAQFAKLMKKAKAARRLLRNQGVQNINDRGMPTSGPVNAYTRGLANELLAYRMAMDLLADPINAEKRATQRQVAEIEQLAEQLEIPILKQESPPEGQIDLTLEPPPEGYRRVTTRKVKRTALGKPGEGIKRVTQQEQHLVKIPEYETMAQPAFQVALPKQEGSAASRAGQQRRLKAISELHQNLMEQRESSEVSLQRRELTPEDIAFYRGADAIRKILPEERASLNLLGAIITAAPQEDRATLIKRAVEGERVDVRKSGQEAATKNVVVVRDRNSGEYLMLSVYRGGDKVVRIYDPRSPSFKRAHSPISEVFFRQYEPQYALQLDMPVRNFGKTFKNEADFREKFLKPARELQKQNDLESQISAIPTERGVEAARNQLNRLKALGMFNDPKQWDDLNAALAQRSREIGIAAPETSRAMVERPGQVERAMRQPLSTAEASAIYSALRLASTEDVGAIERHLMDLKQEAAKTQRTGVPEVERYSGIHQIIRNRARAAAVGLSKVVDKLGLFGMTDAQIASEIANIAAGKNRQQFVQDLQREFLSEKEKTRMAAEELPAPKAEPESQAGELEMRSPEEIAQENVRRREAGLKELGAGLERIYGGTGEPIPFEKYGPKMMTPEEIAYVKSIPWTTNPMKPAAMIKMMRSGIDSVRHAVGDPASGFIRWYSGHMQDRLREGGGARSNEFANKSGVVVDRTKDLLGHMSPVVDAALKEAGKINQATRWVNSFLPLGGKAPNAAVSNLQGGLESWTLSPVHHTPGTPPKLFKVPPYAKRLMDLIADANLLAGRLLERVVQGFQAGGKMEGHFTELGFDGVIAGSGPIYENYLDGMAEANHFRGDPRGGDVAWKEKRLEVEELMRQWRTEVMKPVPDAAALDHINQEFTVKFPVKVTHVRVPGRGIFGGWKQVMHSNAFGYVNNVTRRAAHIRAFRETFPATDKGMREYHQFRTDIGQEHRPGWKPDDASQPAILGNFDALTRALQGHPTDQYGLWRNAPHEILTPGKIIPDAARFFNHSLSRVASALILSKQMVTQLPELMSGSTARYFGPRTYLKAANILANDLLTKQDPRDLWRNPKQFFRDLASKGQLYQELEHRGMVNRIVYDWAFDPSAKMQWGARFTSNVISKLFMENLLNEAQEVMAAASAKIVAERIASGHLSPWEQRQLPLTLRSMGFTPPQIQSLIQNRDLALLDQFQRKAAAFLTGGNKHVAEGSRIGSNRLFNSIFRYQTYPMTKANQFRQDTRNLVDAFKPGHSNAERWAAAEQMAGLVFANTVQGALTAMFAGMMGGALSTNIRAHEAMDQKIKFLFESFFASQSGPYYLLWRNMGYGGMGSGGDQALNMMFPYSISREMMDMANGTGPYRDQFTPEKIGTFIRRKVPGLQPARTAAAIFGLSMDDHDYKVARDSFYRWSKSYYGGEMGRPSTPKTTSDAEFRKHMKRAQGAIVENDNGALLAALLAATGVKDEDAIADSLRGRILLKGTGEGGGLSLEEQSALMNRIGPKAYRLLEFYDEMLLEVAREVRPPSRAE